VLLEGQLADAADELVLLEVSSFEVDESSSDIILSKDSPLAPPLPPPPLQEITRRLK